MFVGKEFNHTIFFISINFNKIMYDKQYIAQSSQFLAILILEHTFQLILFDIISHPLNMSCPAQRQDPFFNLVDYIVLTAVGCP